MELLEDPEHRVIIEITVDFKLHATLVCLRCYLVFHYGQNRVVISLYINSAKVFRLIIWIGGIAKKRRSQINYQIRPDETGLVVKGNFLQSLINVGWNVRENVADPL